MAYDEQALISACQEGDAQAFGQIYDQYIDRIYRFVYYKTLHTETAQDLTSTVFLKALNSVARYDLAKGSFASWLYAIATNTVTDHYRTRTEERSIDDVWDLSTGEDLLVDTDRRLLLESVQEYMHTLNTRQRDILILRLWEELSYQEIAAVMGSSEASCKMLFSRTIKQLRAEMPLAALIALITFSI